MKDDDASGGSFSTSPGVGGNLVQFTSSSDDRATAVSVDLRTAKRFVKVVVTASGSPSTGAKYGVTVALKKVDA